MANSRGETRPSGTASDTTSDTTAEGATAPKPERHGWSHRLAPSGGVMLGLLLGALVWLAVFTLWRLFV
jgi:hypothetical protein